MINRFSRRNFLAGMAAAPVAAALSGKTASAAVGSLPKPGKSGIQHIVLVMMENRSFDHFLGWLPGANGKQAGLTFNNVNNQPQNTARLVNFQNCAYQDPDHSYGGGRTEYDNGNCDGWLIANQSDNFSIGYYTNEDLAFFGQAAPQWTICDNYYAGMMSSTYPNRFYQHAAQTDRISNTTTISTLPTIWDSLDAAGLTGNYYYSDIPFLALWGSKYTAISKPFTQFLSDCATGNLPQFSYIDPRFEDENSGTSGDDHPHADVRNGEIFLNEIYNAVTTGPSWPNTVLVINYDEWGGFFDHVPPPTAPIPAVTAAAGDTDGRLGFRVPLMIVSPWSNGGAINSIQFDHTSVLKMVEWRWGLPTLSVRDAYANNLALALNFSQAKLAVNQYTVPQGPYLGVCGTPTGNSLTAASPNAIEANPVNSNDEELEWEPVRQMAVNFGFAVENSNE